MQGRSIDILVVSNMYPSPRSPSLGVFVDRITRQMVDNGAEVKLSVRALGGGILYSYLTFYICTFFRCVFGGHDLVYVHFITHSWIPVALSRLFRKSRVVVNVHGADIVPDKAWGAFKGRALRKIAEHALRSSDMVISPSVYFKREIESRFPLLSLNIQVSPSGGVNLNDFEFSLPSSDVRRVLFLGRLIEGKGCLQVIPALRHLAASDPGLRFELVFAGDGPLRGRLEGEAASMAGEFPVRFLGEVSPEDVPSVISSCHMLLFPSFRKGESLGLVALEAMACGRPVVAARSGVMPELIEDGVNGALFDPGSISSLAEAISKLLACSNDELNKMACAARTTAERYSSSKVGRELMCLINKGFH